MLLKFLFFGLVGIAGTLAHYSILYGLVEFYKVNAVVASCWGALAGLLVNYSLNFKFTFKSNQQHKQTLPKFGAIALCGMGWNFLLMKLLTPHIYYLYAQVITTIIVLVWNFLLNYFWTFSVEKRTNSIGESFKRIFKPIHSIGLIGVIFLVRLLVSDFYPLYDPSESRYAEMARKMLETSQWIMPMIDYGVPFWGKPPLTIWLTALSLGAVGINEFAARLPSTLLGIGIVWMVYQIAKFQRNGDIAKYAVLMLSSMVLFFVMCGTVAMDQCMTLGVTLAMVAFWRALKAEKCYWGYLFFLGLSIGLMAKGPITIVLTGFALGSWTLVTNSWGLVWKRIPWITGFSLLLLVCVPWYVIAEQYTPGFLKYFFIGEHLKRFTEPGWTGDLYGVGRDHPKGMIWLYWLGGAFPWSLILLYKLGSALYSKQLKTVFSSDDHWQLYCLFWMLSPLLFFTLSANLIWTYVLPGLPGLALLLSELPSLSHNYRKVAALLVPLSFTLIVVAYQSPTLDFYKSQERIVAAYQAQATSDEHLFYLKGRPDSAQFYLKGKTLIIDGVEHLQDHINGQTHDFFVLQNQIADQLPANVMARLELIKEYGRFSLFHQLPSK